MVIYHRGHNSPQWMGHHRKTLCYLLDIRTTLLRVPSVTEMVINVGVTVRVI